MVDVISGWECKVAGTRAAVNTDGKYIPAKGAVAGVLDVAPAALLPGIGSVHAPCSGLPATHDSGDEPKDDGWLEWI